MPQMNLGSIVYDPRLYSGMTFNKVIDEYLPPQCPGTFEGRAQYYNPDTKSCVPLDVREFSTRDLAGSVTSKCGGNMPGGSPFTMEVGGVCYTTNSCPTSSSLSEQCLSGQQIPVRENPLVGPGITCGGCYGSKKWRWV